MALPATARARIGSGGAFIIGVLATAMVGGPVGLHFAKRANTALVVQQQHLTEVQGFETTGAAVDNSVREFSDALVKGRGVEEASEKLTASLSAHTSTTFAMRATMGSEYGAYMAQARKLRTFADNATTPREGVAVWQAAVDLIAFRMRVADRIKREVANA